MKIIIAIDSFKGSLTSQEAGRAAREGILEIYPKADTHLITASDGGEGMLDAYTEAMHAKRIMIETHDAMMRPITAEYGIRDSTAIIEVAQACGLTLVRQEERNAVKATSYGVGEIIADAMNRGCHSFIIGLGGSATTDGGIGMLQALTERIAWKGAHFDDIRLKMHDCEFTLACDVMNPLCGEHGAARIFAPQKGASPAEVEFLEKRLKRFADISAHHFGYDRSTIGGAGAAGGLGYAFLQYLNATRKQGAELLLDLLDFDSLLAKTDLVITGEGTADRQTLMGKLPFVIMQHSQNKNIPTLLISGHIRDREDLIAAGFGSVICITPDGMSTDEAMNSETAQCNIKNTVRTFVNNL